MPGFDPDQPRDEKGQWTAGDASAALKGAASDVKVSDVNYINSKIERIKANRDNPDFKYIVKGELNHAVDEMEMAGVDTETVVEAIEEAIMHQPFETIAVFKNDGKIFNIAVGEEEHVSMSIKRSDEPYLKGGIFTHNHPRDQSFSNGDIYTTLNLGFKEARAASAANDYIFRPNYKYASGNPGLIGMEYDKHLWGVQKELVDDIEEGKMTAKQASELWQHRTMERFAKATNSFYEVRPRPSVRTDVPRELFTQSKYPDFIQAEKVYNRRTEEEREAVQFLKGKKSLEEYREYKNKRGENFL